MRTSLRCSLLFLAIAGGCAGSGSVRYSAHAQVTTPPLVYVDTDVQVIEDYHEPVFYSGNMYWRYDNGAWYRSQYHTRGWLRVETVPAAIRRIERPTAYIRYRGNARGRAEIRDQRHDARPAPIVRDHREHAPPPAPAPTVRDHRDHRDEKHEIKEERKEERQDARQERKEERQEAKEDRKDDRNDRKDDRNDRKDDRKDRKR